MFKNTKKLQRQYDDQELGAESNFYLTEKDQKALRKKAKKESKRDSYKKIHRNESGW